MKKHNLCSEPFAFTRPSFLFCCGPVYWASVDFLAMILNIWRAARFPVFALQALFNLEVRTDMVKKCRAEFPRKLPLGLASLLNCL